MDVLLAQSVFLGMGGTGNYEPATSILLRVDENMKARCFQYPSAVSRCIATTNHRAE